jgi:hypothetical protein
MAGLTQGFRTSGCKVGTIGLFPWLGLTTLRFAAVHDCDTALIPGIPGGFLIGTIYKCEICGLETSSPVRWFVIHCSDSRLGIFKWDSAEADRPKALHFCGEAHAQVYISRWFESFCGSSVMQGGK